MFYVANHPNSKTIGVWLSIVWLCLALTAVCYWKPDVTIKWIHIRKILAWMQLDLFEQYHWQTLYKQYLYITNAVKLLHLKLLKYVHNKDISTKHGIQLRLLTFNKWLKFHAKMPSYFWTVSQEMAGVTLYIYRYTYLHTYFITMVLHCITMW